MICLYCLHTKTCVTNSRPHKKHSQSWRRRQCPECQSVFTTYERPTSDDVLVHHHDGTTTAFNLGKLMLSIARAAQHNQDQAEYDSLFLAQTIELAVIKQVASTHKPTTEVKNKKNSPSIQSKDIATTTHDVLKRFDELTAIQYAMQHHLIVSVRRRGRPSTTATRRADDAERD